MCPCGRHTHTHQHQLTNMLSVVVPITATTDDLMLHNSMAKILTITLVSLFSRLVELWSSCNQSLRSHTIHTKFMMVFKPFEFISKQLNKSRDNYSLTTAVGIGRLYRSVLQTVQDFSLSDITVSHQKKLQEIIVTLDRTTLGPHHPTHWVRFTESFISSSNVHCSGKGTNQTVPNSGTVN